MNTKLNLIKIAVLLFLLTGTFFRLFQFTQTPPSLNWDEVSHGVNAYLISQTGRDEWGQFMPTIFRAYGDYKLPVYIYLTAVVVKMFGLSDISIRAVSMIAGFVAILGMGLLVERIFTDYKEKEKQVLKIISMCALAIMPWHIFLSRIALEANLSLTFIIFSIHGLLGKKSIDKSIGWLLLGLSIHTYNSARVAALIIGLLFVLGDLINRKITDGLWGKALFVLLLVPVFWQLLSGSALARYDKLSLWTDVDRYLVELSRNTQELPTIVERIAFNKYTYITSRILKNYVSYFSPSFWYQTDNPQIQFSLPGKPMWSITVMITLFVGLMLMNGRQRLISIIAILISILPAALTNSPAQALRPLYLIIPITVISTFAIFKIYLKSKPIVLMVMVLMLFESCGYFYTYFKDYSRIYSDSWQYGYKQMIEFVSENRGTKEVIMTKKLGEPHVYAAMYGLYMPEALTSEDNIRFYQSGWYWTDKVGPVYFANDWQMSADSEEVVLESGKTVTYKDKIIVSSAENAPDKATVLKKINDKNGRVVFVVSLYE